ncbi:hypothetical protein [Caminibacter pacificus]
MKKYFIFGIIFIALITLFVYIENNTFTTFSLLGVNISLPNAVWIAVFLGVFFLFSIIFLGFINLKGSLFQKNIKKDTQTLINNIKNKILFIDQTKEVKILKNINQFVKNNINGLEILPKKIEGFEFLEDIEKLKNGETIEISKYKLKPENPWFILNVKNRLKKESNYAREVLKKFKNEELKKEAFYIYAQKAPVYEILKYPYDITFDIVKSHINEEGFEKLLEKAKLSPKEEIEIAKELYGKKDPDSELETIKPLKWGYAYMAIKYSHFDLARQIVEENNLKFFEYYLNLPQKDDIDEYIDSQIC